MCVFVYVLPAQEQPKLSSQVGTVMEASRGGVGARGRLADAARQTRMREFEAFLGNKYAEEVLLFWSEASAAVNNGLAPVSWPFAQCPSCPLLCF